MYFNGNPVAFVNGIEMESLINFIVLVMAKIIFWLQMFFNLFMFYVDVAWYMSIEVLDMSYVSPHDVAMSPSTIYQVTTPLVLGHKFVDDFPITGSGNGSSQKKFWKII